MILIIRINIYICVQKNFYQKFINVVNEYIHIFIYICRIFNVINVFLFICNIKSFDKNSFGHTNICARANIKCYICMLYKHIYMYIKMNFYRK